MAGNMARMRVKSKQAKKNDDLPRKKRNTCRQNEADISRKILKKKYFNDSVPEKEIRSLFPHDIAEEYLTFVRECCNGKRGSAKQTGHEELSNQGSPTKQNKQKEHSSGEHKENMPMQQTDEENDEENNEKSPNGPSKRSRRKQNNPRNLLKCLLCNTIFKTKSDKQAHYDDHLGRRGYECTHCSKAFDKMPALVSHVSRVHLINKELSCKVCGQVFKREFLLRSHSLIHTSKRKFLCAVCKRGFIRKRDLFDHISGHVEYNPYKCDECGKRFQMSCYLSLHRKIHLTVRPFKCKFCDVLCLNYSDVGVHALSHAEGLGVDCVDCNVRVPTRMYTLHSISHERKKTLQCTLCPAKFHAESTLGDHIKAHKLIKEYKCDVCNEIMLTVSECSAHVCPKETNQKVSDLHLCKICNVYIKQCHVQKHNQRHVPKEGFSSGGKQLEMDLMELSDEEEEVWACREHVATNNIIKNSSFDYGVSDSQDDSDDSSVSDSSSFLSDDDDKSSLFESTSSSSSKNVTSEQCNEPLNLSGGLFQGVTLEQSDFEEDEDESE